ncbi:recombinase family protein [Actinacidiphila oryziradicis]|uniref:recombinase family protein n=1 Tax=Actinacidiphila oryziradicis TaxID=2571141 RepID=UPI001FEBCA91|nr:recombinase family protein [Actinacidiphila oryziradicis]
MRVRPHFEAALAAAREIKAHAPHCRVIFTVYEMKRLGRDAAELTALADHLTAHGLVLEMLAGPLQGMYDPSGTGPPAVRVLRGDRPRPSARAFARPPSKGWTPRPARATTAADLRSSPMTCCAQCSAAARTARRSSRFRPT